MRKFLISLAAAVLILTGCGAKDESTILSGICTPVLDNAYSAIYPNDDGYFAVDYCDNTYDYEVLWGNEEPQKYIKILYLDPDCNVTEEIPLDMETFSSPSEVGERGFYMIADDVLSHIDWSGNIAAQITLDDICPDNNPKDSARFITATETGLAVAWGDTLIMLSADLKVDGIYELPGTCGAVSSEDDCIWMTYSVRENKETVWYLGKWENGAVDESWLMPVEVTYIPRQGSMMIDCADGWLYGWKQNTGVFRWQFDSDEEEPVIETELDFANSGIIASDVYFVGKIHGHDLYTVTTLADNPYNSFKSEEYRTLYRKAEDRDLSEMKVMTLACTSQSSNMAEAVIRFNAAHDDAYIRIESYDKYQTDGFYGDLVDRFELDLNSGILKPDIIMGYTYSPIDLYPYMTGEITPDDIADCVKGRYETNGALYQIGPNFRFNTLAAKSDSLGGMTNRNLEEFLDLYFSLEDGEYILDGLGRNNAAKFLFGDNVYSCFIRDGEACFDDPLYQRYLEFLASLPENGEPLMNNSAGGNAYLAAGDLDGFESSGGSTDGENLYFNGRIKFASSMDYISNPIPGVSHLRDIFEICNVFGTTDVELIGYPAGDKSSISVFYTGDNYSVTSYCQYPELAWEFIESVMLESETLPENDTLLYEFTTLKEPYMKYLDSMTGYEFFKAFDKSRVNEGWDISPDSSVPGLEFSVDEKILTIVEDIYNNAGYNSTVSIKIRDIAREEESRYLAGVISADECAANVQNRVKIYLSEVE